MEYTAINNFFLKDSIVFQLISTQIGTNNRPSPMKNKLRLSNEEYLANEDTFLTALVSYRVGYIEIVLEFP